MAEEAKEKSEGKAAAPKTGGKKAALAGPLTLLIPAGAGLLAAGLGIVLGLLVIGPKAAAMRSGTSVTEKKDDGGAKHEKKGKEGEKTAVFKLDNLIVNPAGSGGTRFLLASVAIELPDEKLLSRLRERDFQVRDAVISVLERETLDEVASPGARDSIKARLARVIAPMAGHGTQVQVYLPQFVLQ
jgi:flagellar protein FliL